MENGSRVQWSEWRDEDRDAHPEEFYLIADEIPGGWAFYERSCWELRWYQIPATGALLARAKSENSKQKVPLSMRRVA